MLKTQFQLIPVIIITVLQVCKCELKRETNSGFPSNTTGNIKHLPSRPAYEPLPPNRFSAAHSTDTNNTARTVNQLKDHQFIIRNVRNAINTGNLYQSLFENHLHYLTNYM